MNSQILSILLQIKDEYGANVFKKGGKLKAYLDDLLSVPELKRTKMLITNAIDNMDAYFVTKNASEEHRIFDIEKLISQMVEDYGVDQEYAEETIWLIANILGHVRPEKVVGNVVEKPAENILQATENLEKKSEYHNNRGVAYLKNKQHDLAVAEFSKAIELNPQDAYSYARRGSAYLKNKDYSSAIADFDEAIELNPYVASIYYQRGKTYYQTGEYDLAITDFNEAIKLEPDNGNYYFYRGGFYYQINENDLAIEDFNQAIKLDPDDEVNYIFRGLAYRKKGNEIQAKRNFEKAVAINPQNKTAVKYLRS